MLKRQPMLIPERLEVTADAERAVKVLTPQKLREKQEAKRREDATDTEYWFAVAFPSRALKEEFLGKLDVRQLGNKYIDGMALAAALGIELDGQPPKWGEARTNAKLEALARTPALAEEAE